jgi:hypothetical protein
MAGAIDNHVGKAVPSGGLRTPYSHLGRMPCEDTRAAGRVLLNEPPRLSQP